MPTRWRWPPERVRIFALAFSSRFTAATTSRMAALGFFQALEGGHVV